MMTVDGKLHIIGDQVKEAIRKSGVPIEHIAADLKMSKQTIYNIIDGNLNYTVNNLFSIFTYVGLDCDIFETEKTKDK